MGATAYVGTSGYQYGHWRGPFYPPDLPKGRWFAHYAERFDSVEINNTFYRLPAPEVFERWREQAPPGFRYALKYSRYATHMKRLRDPGPTLDHFLAAARRLEATLGPVLVQLPPHWRVNPPRLEQFLEALATELRWAFEFRDPSWLCEEVYALLARHGAALCIHDMIPDHPQRITTDWVYLRFHGDHYRGSYSAGELRTQAGEIGAHLAAGRDVYAYFNNDEAGYAAANALTLKRYLNR